MVTVARIRFFTSGIWQLEQKEEAQGARGPWQVASLGLKQHADLAAAA